MMSGVGPLAAAVTDDLVHMYLELEQLVVLVQSGSVPKRLAQDTFELFEALTGLEQAE